MHMVICPVCHAPLLREKTVWHCENGHSFDVARQGYVNLLTVQQKHSLHPGDTREMVLARRNFLDAGHYLPIANKLRDLIVQFAPEAKSVLDVGCGEGYYLSNLAHIPTRVGIDISKEAVRYAASRDKNAIWLTATAAHLPFADGSFDNVLSMFALTAEAEFCRILKENGVFVQVLAGKRHLSALKNIIYAEILEKEKNLQPQPQGFTLLHSETLCFDFSVESAEMLQNLLYMTPHVWRISKEAAHNLSQTDYLEDRAEVVFNVYQR